MIDIIAARALRETLRLRLRVLDRDLFATGDPGQNTHTLRERIRSLRPLAAVQPDEPSR